MAEHREPPPLFDDDDSRRDDDNEDLFSSAVQSPVNGQVTPEVNAPQATTAAALQPSNPSPTPPVSDTTPSTPASSDRSSLVAVHPFSDPLQLVADPIATSANSYNSSSNLVQPALGSFDSLGGAVNDLNTSMANTLEANSSDLNSSSDSFIVQSGSALPSYSASVMLEPVDLDSVGQAAVGESRRIIDNDGLHFESATNPSLDSEHTSLTSTTLGNLPPVPSNMYNISSMAGVEDSNNSMDLFESCVEDAIVRPFSTVSLSAPQEVSLDDDDDGLFSSGVLDTSSAQMKNSNAPIDASAPSTLPPMGAPITPPVVSPSSDHPQAPLYCANTDANSITTPPMPAALVVGQPAGFYAPSQPASLDRTSSSNANTDGEFIEILISEPQKVGDGMGSYMAYKMTTRTNISFFRKQCWSVTRRFSDYLGLHAKLVEKHLHAGRIIPPAPEKDALNTTKLRLSSGEGVDGAAEFLERRRASLQRYMQRTAALPHLRTDPDFREFVELDSDLPRATQTSAMSSAGVLRLFNRVGETVNKITFKMEESDQWFEERAQQVEALEAELRRLHAALEGLAGGRRELAAGSSALSKAAAVLSSVEEHSALSRALHQLAEATDRTHTVYHAQADADFYILCETTRDYINLIGAVKEVFHERVKVFQAWQYSQTMLAKKREAKAKLELTARQEKVAQAQQEVHEWEGKVERNQEHFERISGAIKKELEQFDVVRVQDFKSMLVRYLEAMVTSQQQVIKVWESFLPEAKAIS